MQLYKIREVFWVKKDGGKRDGLNLRKNPKSPKAFSTIRICFFAQNAQILELPLRIKTKTRREEQPRRVIADDVGGARAEYPPKPQKEPRAENPLESRPDAHRLSLVRFLLSRHQTWRWRFAKIIRLLIISPTNRPRSLIKCQILRYFKRLEFAKIMGKSGRFERPHYFSKYNRLCLYNRQREIRMLGRGGKFLLTRS